MKKKSSYMALALVCSLFFLNFLYTVNLGAGWNYSYSIETDDEYIYECTTSLYKNGSDDDPYNDHPTKKHQVRVKVIASDLVGGEGSVRYKAWYLPVGSGDWEVLF